MPLRPGRRRLRVRLVVLAALTASLLLGVPYGLREWSRWLHTDRPAAAHVDIAALFLDQSTVPITIRGGIAPWTTSISELRSSPVLWRRMHVADWDGVEAGLRHVGLQQLVHRYRAVIMTPGQWDRMRPRDWDRIPQPIRILAFRQMVAYWVGFYHLGDRDGLSRATIRETLSAIVMSESWFDHRAVSVSRDGNRDLGLVQASDYARTRLCQLYENGMVDTCFSDPDYFNPWKATQFLAVWFDLLLRESRGDIGKAMRAYHRGIAQANDAAGDRYAATVERRLTRFIRPKAGPPAWVELNQLRQAIDPLDLGDAALQDLNR